MTENTSRHSDIPRSLKWILKLSVTGGLGYLLVRRLDFQQVQDILPTLNLNLVLLAFLIFILRNIISSLRWKTLLSAKGYQLPLFALIRYYIIGNFFGLFIPTAVGGDIARGFYIYQRGVSSRDSASSVLVERTLGISVMMAFTLISLVIDFDLISDIRIKIILTISSLSTFLILFTFYLLPLPDLSRISNLNQLSKIIKKIQEVVNSIHHYREEPLNLGIAIFHSATYQLAGIVTYYLLGLATGADTSLIAYLLIMPIVWLLIMLPISLNGLGIRESSFVFLAGLVGMEREIATVVSVLYLAITFAQGIIGGLFFLLDRQQLETVKNYSQLAQSKNKEVFDDETTFL